MRPGRHGDFRRESKSLATHDAGSYYEHVSATMPLISERDNAAAFAVRVQPRARKNALKGEVDGALKVARTAPPIEGRANDACIEFFAKLLKVPRSSVTIASGASSRNKVLRIAGVTADYVRDRLRQ